MQRLNLWRYHARIAAIVVGGILAGSASAGQSTWQFERPGKQPTADAVPDAETAVAIGMAFLSGSSELEEYKPWHAELNERDEWEVRGTLPDNWIGGTYLVVISKHDGKVIHIYHEQ